MGLGAIPHQIFKLPKIAARWVTIVVRWRTLRPSWYACFFSFGWPLPAAFIRDSRHVEIHNFLVQAVKMSQCAPISASYTESLRSGRTQRSMARMRVLMRHMDTVSTGEPCRMRMLAAW